MNPKERKQENKTLAVLFITFSLAVLVGILLLWRSWAKRPWFSEEALADTASLQYLGQFGDMFGGLTALFTALAFGGVLVTVLLQVYELRKQREEFQASAEALKKQAATTEASFRLAAMNAIVGGLQTQFAATPTDDPERRFLRQEIARSVGELRVLLRSETISADVPSRFAADRELSMAELENEIPISIPYLSSERIRSEGEKLLAYFLNQGVNTVNRLKEVLSNSRAIETVEKFYIEELFRDPDCPLDPAAVGAWISQLHLGRNSAQVEAQLRSTIHSCQEAKQKREKNRQLPPVVSGGQSWSVGEPCVVVFANNEVRPVPHFNAAIAQVRSSEKKGTILIFDYDMNTWREPKKGA